MPGVLERMKAVDTGTSTKSAPPEAAVGVAVPRSAGRRFWSRAGLLAAGSLALRQSLASAAASRSGTAAPLSSDRDKIAHLLRRAAFGFSRDDLDFYLPLGVTGAVDYLLAYDQVADDVDERIAAANLDLNNGGDLQRSWLLRMMYSRRPLQEKMTLFWHGLLVSGTGKVGLPQRDPTDPTGRTYRPLPTPRMQNQVQFLRDHALDDWPSIMKGISRDPAMIVYLDTRDNRKGKPNENYARELMELFTLGLAGPDGAPNYTEQDVREAARAFTGWGLNREEQFVFTPALHDGGAKAIFGQTGNFNGDDVIDLIMRHPSSAYYLCRRLWSFFAFDAPEPETLQPVIDAFKSSGLSTRAAVRAILTSPAFYSERAYRAKVKSPVEYLASIARGLKIETNASGWQNSAARMGQTLYNPPNVAGWPGGMQWVSSSAWVERVNQLSRVLAIRQDPNISPVRFQPAAEQYGWSTAEQVVDNFVSLYLDGQIPPEQRQALVAYMHEGGFWPLRAGGTLRETDPALDRKVRGLAYLVMASPEFQLA